MIVLYVKNIYQLFVSFAEMLFIGHEFVHVQDGC